MKTKWTCPKCHREWEFATPHVYCPVCKKEPMKHPMFIESNYTVRRMSLDLLNEYVHGTTAMRPDQPIFTGEGWYRNGKEWILIRNPFPDEWQMLVYGEDPREEFKRVSALPEIP